VIVKDFVWPIDRDRFARLLDHHIHHEDSPEVTPINCGWATQKGDGKQPYVRDRIIEPGTY
jgi:hypothetical protein